ncbi:hypothetical protein EVAR_38127_1 [Eumeta japonica]|uniref:Uncharacterized protein n=1 Tax=Eumeta variegata TaxID=151549 RepID=A0A4C1X4K8_EUMVA|nr:hypothetical protein EVAR_38127_1 [Eumeta japonica]
MLEYNLPDSMSIAAIKESKLSYRCSRAHRPPEVEDRERNRRRTGIRIKSVTGIKIKNSAGTRIKRGNDKRPKSDRLSRLDLSARVAHLTGTHAKSESTNENQTRTWRCLVVDCSSFQFSTGLRTFLGPGFSFVPDNKLKSGFAYKGRLSSPRNALLSLERCLESTGPRLKRVLRSLTLSSSPAILRHCDAFVTNFKAIKYHALYCNSDALDQMEREDIEQPLPDIVVTLVTAVVSSPNQHCACVESLMSRSLNLKQKRLWENEGLDLQSYTLVRCRSGVADARRHRRDDSFYGRRLEVLSEWYSSKKPIGQFA